MQCTGMMMVLWNDDGNDVGVRSEEDEGTECEDGESDAGW